MDFRDDLYFMMLTIEQEAGGEIYEGKLAVAYVIVNRMGRNSAINIVLAPSQFSCWDTDSITRRSITAAPIEIQEECYKASVSAYFRLVDDPTKGATSYLNEEETIREDGKLPSWFDESKVTARIGNQTFLKLGG